MKNVILLTSIFFSISILSYGQRTINPKYDDLIIPSLAKVYLASFSLDSDLKSILEKQKSNTESAHNNRVIKQSLDSTINYSWNTLTNQYVPFLNTSYTYNYNGNITQYVTQYWDVNKWDDRNKNAYTYNSDGYQTESIYYYWNNSNNNWVTDRKYLYSYNVNGKAIESTSLYWNPTLNQWVTFSKYELVYDLNGNNSLATRYLWSVSANQFIQDYKAEHVYDGNNKLINSMYNNWDTTLNQWVNSYKVDFTYNVDGVKVSTEASYWDEDLVQWIESYKTENTLDVNGNQTLSLSFTWNLDSNKWKNYAKYEATFDANNNPIISTFFWWDPVTNLWLINDRSLNTYNNSFTYEDLLLPFVDEYSPVFYNHMITTFTGENWDTLSSSWVTNNKLDYYFSSVNINSVPEINSSEVAAYPNPFNNQITFNIAENNSTFLVSIFDTQGREVITQSVKNNEAIRLGYLSSGLYFYSITVGKKKLRGKIAKN